MLARISGFIACSSLLAAVGCALPRPSQVPASPPPGSASGCVSGAFDASHVEKQAGPATVLVATNHGAGSGFVINDGAEQLVVTNYHVVAAGVQHVATQALADGSQRRVPLEVVLVSRQRDLALLRPSAKLGTSGLSLAGKAPDVGTSVAVVGYPGVAGSNWALTFEPGTVTATERRVDALDFIQTNANINPGNSGGPLVDSCGQVVGVVTARHNSAERVGLVIPASAVNALLQEYRRPQLAPQAAAEAQLQRLFTEVKFRRSDKAAHFFTRRFVEKAALADLQALVAQLNQKVQKLKVSFRKQGRDIAKLDRAALEKALGGGDQARAELEAADLASAVAANKLTAYDAAHRLLASQSADMFGDLDDVWVESTSPTKEGCIDAYVTASSAAQTRRYVVHLHRENGEWLVDSVTQMR